MGRGGDRKKRKVLLYAIHTLYTSWKEERRMFFNGAVAPTRGRVSVSSKSRESMSCA